VINLVDSLDRLKIREKDLEAVRSFYDSQKFEEQFNELTKISQQEDFWQHLDFVSKSKELSIITEIRNSYLILIKDYDQIKDLILLFGSDQESEDALEVAIEIDKLCSRISQFKIELLLDGDYDQDNCFVSITPGAGGTESQDWAEMLLRMYTRFCERNKLSAKMIDHQKGNEAGIKNAILNISGKNAYGVLKSESGIHRLVRISPFDSNKRRHTSFASVLVSPEVEESPVEIKPDDLRIDTYRSGGAGGQHVNTTDSAVRITHLPTNIVVQCQNERSQGQNKQQAMKMLYSRLVAYEERKKKEAASLTEKQKIEWGSQIRSYVLHPYKMVKDHRTNAESAQPEDVLDGNLQIFMIQRL
jgi:peptide chain release factor 2